MAFGVGSIIAKLGIDTSGYTKGINDATGLSQIFGQTFSTFVTNPVLGGISALNDFGKAALDAFSQELGNVEALTKIRDQTGLSTKLIQTLQEGMKLSGGSTDDATTAIIRFSDTVGQARQGAENATATFAKLGIDPSQFSSMDQLLGKTLDQLAHVEDQALRTSIAQDLFSRGGSRFAASFADGSRTIGEMMNLLDRRNVLYSEGAIQSLSRIDDQVDDIGLAWEGLRRTVVVDFLQGLDKQAEQSGVKIADVLTHAGESVRSVFASAGAEVGKVISQVEKLIERMERLGTVKGLIVTGFESVQPDTSIPREMIRELTETGRRRRSAGRLP